MESRHLAFFVAVAEELHFTRAAARLNIAQPHLSQEIKRLEEKLGVTLFQRTKRKVELTSAGRVFLEKVRHIQDATDDAVRAAQSAQRGDTGSVRLGFVTVSSFDLGPKAVRRFRDKHPGVDIHVEDQFSTRVVEAVEDGRLDMCVAHPPRILSDKLYVEDLYFEEMVAVLPSDHPLAAGETCSLFDLLNENWLMGERESSSRLSDEVQSVLNIIGRFPSGRRVRARMATLVCLVAGGFGVMVLPASAQRLGVEGVAFRPLTGRPIQVPVSLVTRRDPLTPAQQAFADVICETAAQRAQGDTRASATVR